MERTTDKQAQIITTKMLQIGYTFLLGLIGIVLMILGAIAISNKSGNWNDIVDVNAKNSYIAMLVIGLVLMAYSAYSGFVTFRMFKEAKTGSLSDLTAILAASTLNIFGYMLINESNGKVKPKKEKSKTKK